MLFGFWLILFCCFCFPSWCLQDPIKKAIDLTQEHSSHLRVFEANSEFERILSLDPLNNIQRSRYAWHLQAFSLFPEALYQFRLLLGGESENRYLYQTMGWDCYNLGKLEEALSNFSHLYCLREPTLKDQFFVINNLFQSEYLERIDAWERSLECANEEEAIEIKKRIFESYIYIGDVEKASSFALEILSKDPDEYMVRYRYAHLLYQKKRYSEACVEFDRLIEQLPCNAFLYWNLGQILEAMGSYDDAKKAYEKALFFHSNPRTRWSFAAILSKIDDCSDALELAEQVEEDPSEVLPSQLSRAEIYLHCKDYETAACIYRNILSEYPYHREALWGLLKSSTHTRNSDDARLSYSRWPVVWFDKPVENRLAEFYRPPEIRLPLEYYQDSTRFNRTSIGFDYNVYLFQNSRAYAKTYYTRFSQKHYDAINRGTLSFSLDTLFNQYLESHVELLGNFYDHLQHDPLPSGQPLYAKAVLNYHLHLIYHKLPEFTVDLGYDDYDVIDTVPPFLNPVYNYSNQIGATSLNVRTKDWNLFVGLFPKKFYLTANIVHGNYSDDNVKNTRSFRAGYRFYNIPSMSIYYNYFYLNFKNPAPLFSQNGRIESAYYDPINFEVHAVGADSHYALSETMETGGEATLIYIPKCRNWGCSGFGYFKYLISDQWSCRFDLRFYYQRQGVVRKGITGEFHAENASARIHYEF